MQFSTLLISDLLMTDTNFALCFWSFLRCIGIGFIDDGLSWFFSGFIDIADIAGMKGCIVDEQLFQLVDS